MKNNSNKFYSVTAIFFVIILSNCFGSIGAGGHLMPQKAENIELVKNYYSDDTAQITMDSKVFRISGSWVKQGSQSLEIEIENRSDSEFQFNFRKVKFESASGESVDLDNVVDLTDVNLADNSPNNDEIKYLYKNGNSPGNGKLIVPPKQTKKIGVGFDNFQKEENLLREGNQVIVSLPLGETSTDLTRIIFNCAAGKSVF